MPTLGASAGDPVAGAGSATAAGHSTFGHCAAAAGGHSCCTSPAARAHITLMWIQTLESLIISGKLARSAHDIQHCEVLTLTSWGQYSELSGIKSLGGSHEGMFWRIRASSQRMQVRSSWIKRVNQRLEKDCRVLLSF